MLPVVLHGYWRSSAAYRVRIALGLKGIPFEQVSHDLRTGAQNQPAYREIAPHGLVPALECYDACSLGWEHAAGRSLREFIETGHGVPF